MRTKYLFAVGVAGVLAACASVPNVVFEDADGAAGTITLPDGAVISTTDSGGGGMDSGSGKDSSTGPKDSGVNTIDGGNPCGAGAGEICCGTKVCHGCSAGDCAQCTGLGCAGTDVCCKKGMNLTCHVPGTGGC